MRPWRTQTVPNGKPNVREHIWGWDAIGGWVAIVGLLVTILGVIVGDRISIEHRLSLPRELTESDKAEIAALIAEAIEQHDRGYLDSDDLKSAMSTAVAKIDGKFEMVNYRLDRIESVGRYTTRILSTINLPNKENTP